ncbi:Mis12-Mtw1 protein family-domain-containing protein [Cantharellus anzutake]|uniref:Mis12-Mtw1 protein family-domain-containing protein n=1 Tax=Cantharellus anzutake TaxID=1750568 RepID=UPI001905D1BD|nr:Mis12-Mtw1 protein family-domain-containing protein [Cantharellus anzutake]KAF8339920.1 Mis12-Mtw1 protein family-domain-containing protein [Cantharellus anzutake]
MRAEASERRRNSIDHRRQRSTSIGKSGGIITPHPTVEPKQYHRHISAEIPPPQRMRQLLVWTSSYAHSQASSSSKRSLPVLSAESTRILRRVQDAVIRQLADGSINTSVYSTKGKEGRSQPLKSNPRNIKNQERLQKWGDNIARAKAEGEVWQDILKSANEYLSQTRVASQSRKEPTLADWLHHLDERWRASAELAERTLQASSSIDEGEDVRLQEMLQEIHHDVDTLHSDVNTMSEVTRRVDAFLSKYFSAISLNIDSRGTRTGAPSAMDVITTIQPPSSISDDLYHVDNESNSRDMFGALRALSRLEPGESRSEKSNAVMRAVNELEGGVTRKITAVPQTPGRTPRKASTPGRKR